MMEERCKNELEEVVGGGNSLFKNSRTVPYKTSGQGGTGNIQLIREIFVDEVKGYMKKTEAWMWYKQRRMVQDKNKWRVFEQE